MCIWQEFLYLFDNDQGFLFVFVKAFYMRDNEDGETVDSFDLLVPGKF